MESVTKYLHAHRDAHLARLCEWLRMPSISADPAYDAQTGQAATFIADHLRRIGLSNVERWKTDAHDVVYGEWLKAPGQPTIMLYGHYDVQPPGDEAAWATPPFEPTVRGRTLWGRGTADDKGQTMMACNAIEAWLAAAGKLPVNLKCYIEGDEESGPAGADAVSTYAERLGCDAIMICDTSWTAPDLPSIYYGARGLAYYEVTVRGPATDIHSGMYGNVVTNPANVLCEVLGKVRGADGRIAIPGFYDHVVSPTDAERTWMREFPVDAPAVCATTGAPTLMTPLPGETPRTMLCTLPSFDLCGLVGGYTGAGPKTIIPQSARAKVSFRLVANQDPAQVTVQFRKFLADHMPAGVACDCASLNESPAWLTPIDDPYLQQAATVFREQCGRVLVAREGASIPIVANFREVLNVPVILCGMGLPDDGIHTTAEKFSLDQYDKGAECIAHMLQAFAKDMNDI